MRTMPKQKQLHTSQSGMVAIMVTLIMMIVISLIVLGFAQVSRRTQRNTLDSQLSAQAFYAAESGLNDAVTIIKAQVALGAAIPPKTTCANSGPYLFDPVLSTIGSASDNVSYSCVTIDPTPTKLFYKLGTNSSEVIKLKSSGGQAINTLTYSWVPSPGQDTAPIANCPVSASQYPVATGAGAWNCKFPVLRTELAPAAVLSRAGLVTGTHVNFLEPVRAGGTGSISWASDNAKSVAASCAAVCTTTVNFSGAGVNSYYLHLNPLYGSTTVTITAKDAGGADIAFGEVQAQVGVTGKAQDVLRRILVAVSLDGTPKSSPSVALMSGDSLCKRFSVTGGSFKVDDFNAQGSNGNPLCEPQSSGTPTNP